jgi:hypothetical protein
MDEILIWCDAKIKISRFRYFFQILQNMFKNDFLQHRNKNKIDWGQSQNLLFFMFTNLNDQKIILTKDQNEKHAWENSSFSRLTKAER